MDDHLDNALRYFGLEEIDFQRMTVTEEQIEEFNLPPMPKSKETIDKVNHDTRKDGFIKKYGKLYVVELDALFFFDEFKSLPLVARLSQLLRAARKTATYKR